jgi:hypothetical protein
VVAKTEYGELIVVRGLGKSNEGGPFYSPVRELQYQSVFRDETGLMGYLDSLEPWTPP